MINWEASTILPPFPRCQYSGCSDVREALKESCTHLIFFIVIFCICQRDLSPVAALWRSGRVSVRTFPDRVRGPTERRAEDCGGKTWGVSPSFNQHTIWYQCTWCRIQQLVQADYISVGYHIVLCRGYESPEFLKWFLVELWLKSSSLPEMWGIGDVSSP